MTSQQARAVALVVDAASLHRGILALVCEEAGYDAVSAASGEDALTLIESRSPSLIVTDLALPGMDGFKLLHAIADSQTTGQLVLVSERGSSILNSAHRLGHTLGFEVLGSFHKPFLPEDLLGLLRQRAEDGPQQKAAKKESETRLDRAAIRSGIEAGAVVAYYQPKIHYPDSRIAGFECLARWRTEGGEILGADAFVPTAEECGLMASLTAVMLEHGIRDAAAWQSYGWPVPISINLSTDNLMDSNLPDHLEWLVATHGVSPSAITLEITESKVMSDADACLEVMSRLRLKGFGLSVDDFGTGYSTLKQLQYFPFTELKLDQSYVSAALHHQPSRAVLETGIQLAKGLSLTCIAEGVETTAHADLLASLGCNHHQGYLYAKPIAATDVPVWISGWLERGGTMMQPDLVMPGAGAKNQPYHSGPVHRPLGQASAASLPG